MKRFNPSNIEPKWQKIWDDEQVYKADLSSNKPKYFAMSMFNYPSGILHIGHAMNYTISDVMARYKRQQGYESYHPVGWDSFGLPAENRAIKEGVSPQVSMAELIPKYHDLYKTMGWSNDWSKEIATHDPRYYKWTQWVFSEMFRNNLAYREPRMQWWCNKCQTVLANEQVIDGKCWRHDAPDDPLVEKKEVNQWFFKITDYADKILEATDDLDWTESVKLAQKNWIGKSVGAEVNFEVVSSQSSFSETASRRDSNRVSMSLESRAADVSENETASDSTKITVFTTRPDTIFGATFLVLAPEHPLVETLVNDETRQTVNDYISVSTKKTELERMSETKDKTGVFTGSHVTNPATGEKIPIWIADYVLFGYGTGAIMAVPAHDERDFEFAEKFNISIKQVVAPFKIYGGDKTPRDDVETKYRPTIDAIITDGNGKYLLQIEDENNIHFVGGGIDAEDETVEAAVRREVVEETGFTDIVSIKQAAPFTSGLAYRNGKNRNQHTWGAYYEVVINPAVQIPSEIDEGLHTVEWLTKAEVAKKITWEFHQEGWQYYLNNQKIPSEVYEGILVNSGHFDGMATSEAREEVVAWLEKQGIGKSKTTYKMRDWSVSRQRYWGAPIPIIHCKTCGPQLVPDDELPVVLPELKDFQPSGDGRSALARATDWLEVDCPNCGESAERETDTLDTYICSSWYFLRYLDPESRDAMISPEIAKKWMPVDFYNGADHATAHLLYARFIARFFYERHGIGTPEPFKKFLFNGKVTASDGTMFSKSKGNGVDPLEIINSGYGADALRTYLMFAAPLDTWIRWDSQGVPGTHRFLNRIWNLTQEFLESDSSENNDATLTIIHPLIKKVTRDLEHQKYNTAIAAMMEATNKLYELKARKEFGGSKNWQFALESLVALVAPFAPHMADELWHELGRKTSVQRDSWPKWDDHYLSSDTMTIIVQVNGKLRAKLEVANDISEGDAKARALADEKVQTFVGDKTPTKLIYVPGRLVNIVV